MLVFWKQKLVLLAVPKTGTTALEAALLPHASASVLNPPGLKHVSAGRYNKGPKRFFEQNGRNPMQLVAVMREPIEWLGSWYRYRGRPQLQGKTNSTADISFDEFIEAWLQPEPPEFANVGSQAHFLTGGGSEPLVEHLFRYDRMQDLVHFMEERLEIQLTLGRANVSPKAELSVSDRSRSLLQERAAEEFALWERLCAQ